MKKIRDLLTKLAFQKTISFCYSCYHRAPEGVCTKCGSDDLMRELPGVGLEWGTEWVILELLSQHLKTADLEEYFAQSVSDAYGDSAKIGWLEYDTVGAIKTLDPISWQHALSEHIDSEVSEGNLITFDELNYYWRHEVEELIADHLQ